MYHTELHRVTDISHIYRWITQLQTNHTVADKAHRDADKSHRITDKSHRVTDRSCRVADKPHRVTDKSHRVKTQIFISEHSLPLLYQSVITHVC